MRKRQAIAFGGVALASIGCDHASKQLAQQALEAGGVSWAGGALRFELAFNPGAFMSLGASLPPVLREALLLVGVPLLLAGFCTVLLRDQALRSRESLSLGLIVGGGLANWLDRILHSGTVTDFVSLGLGPLRTGIFNLADVAIVAGLLLLVLPGGLVAERRQPT
jgi:signal peptidase II